jgi:hypothetical protein
MVIILFPFSDFSLSNYCARFLVGIEASHQQVHNELTAFLILFFICRSSTIGILRRKKIIAQLRPFSYCHVITIFCYNAPQKNYQARSKAIVEESQEAWSNTSQYPGNTSSRTYNIRGSVLSTFFRSIVYLELSDHICYSWDPLLDLSASERPILTTLRLPITVVERPTTRLRTMLPLSSPPFM